ncbi:MAG TPA: SpoIIE family protein phosphatase [bacterium]|nr:SpoIIE family protein phosphatase [bacterium]
MDKVPLELSAEEQLRLIQKAADVTAEGIVITDTSLPDNPIIYANKGFERLTGYSRDFIVGKNCRFLQGEETDPDAVEEIRDGLKTEQGCVVELLNYRKDGAKFWNRLSISPIRNEAGVVTNYVGIQSDITELNETRDQLERANRELRKFHTEMTEELQQARQAQEFILPHQLPVNDQVKMASKFDPLADIGGDFFDVVHLPEERYGMLIADVTGHGIPAALLCFMSSNTFKTISRNNPSTESVLQQTNHLLTGAMPAGTFVTMFYVIYNARQKELIYTQAGHPPGFLISGQSGEVITLSTRGTPLGILEESMVTFEEKSIRLASGDKVLLYTDAINEAGGIDGDFLDPEHLRAFLINHTQSGIEELIDRVYSYGLEFSGMRDYSDDATLIGFEVLK